VTDRRSTECSCSGPEDSDGPQLTAGIATSTTSSRRSSATASWFENLAGARAQPTSEIRKAGERATASPPAHAFTRKRSRIAGVDLTTIVVDGQMLSDHRRDIGSTSTAAKLDRVKPMRTDRR
jgi:hypothetical protein